MDMSGFIIGIVIGVVVAFGTGFFKKAGEESYLWFKRKLNPKLPAENAPQVVVHLHSGGEEGRALSADTRLAPASIERLNLVTYDDIEKAIDDAPPLQREEVAKRFIGLKVEWDSYLRTAYTRADGNVRLRLAVDKQYRGRAIVCEVPGNEYRELGILPEGSHIRVSGEISAASYGEIELSNVNLQIFPSTMNT